MTSVIEVVFPHPRTGGISVDVRPGDDAIAPIVGAGAVLESDPSGYDNRKNHEAIRTRCFIAASPR